MPANLPLFPALPFYGLNAGIKTEYGTLLPPASRVTYLRSTGQQSGDNPDVVARLTTTLAAALAECRSGMGDIVYVLPGHSEAVISTSFSAAVAGTRILGLGDLNRDDAPTFSWGATTSQWAIAVKNIEISGLRLMMDGANGVVKAIAITASGCRIVGNYISLASGAALKATIGIEVGSAATDCTIAGNYVTGTATHNVTDGIKVVGATVPSRLSIVGNTMIASATAGNGLVHLTVAALNVLIQGNIIYNTHTASTACIAVDAVAADGVIADNYVGTKNNGTATAQGIVFGAGGLFVCFNNFSDDQPILSGILTPVAAT